MNIKEKELLTTTYNHYKETGDRSIQFTFNNSINEKRATINALDALESDGYIEYSYRALGFYGVEITSIGIKFIENNFEDVENSHPIIQGNNNIYVHGSCNTVTNNYNKISANIDGYDLPDDCKELIKTLLFELRTPNLSQEKKSCKIKQFLSDISSDTISSVAASGLTALLMSLFNSISF